MLSNNSAENGLFSKGGEFYRSLEGYRAVLAGFAAGLVLITLTYWSGFFNGLIFPYHRYYGEGDVFQRYVMIAIAGMAGFGLGWFLSPQAKAARAMIFGAIMAAICFVVSVDYGYLGWGFASIGACFAFFAGLGYWVRNFARRIAQRPTTFGSARWAKHDDLVVNDLVGKSGLRLGSFGGEESAVPMHYTGDRHVLTIAPTRSGKGTSAIIPNLLTYNGSVVIIDPKDENALVTAKCRAAMGQKVHVIDPWGITGIESARFNPMDWLVPGDVDMAENSLLLADAIIKVESKSEPFFDTMAKAVLDGLILYTATDPQEKGQRHLGRVRDLLMLDEVNLQKLFARMVKSSHHKVRSTGTSLQGKDAKLLSNILASVQAQTAFLDSSRIRESLSC